jgi:hypothetical protein
MTPGAPPAVSQRLRVRWGRWRLDRELAEGRPPESSDVHALRARQLAAPPVRGEVAASLRRVVDDAAQPYEVLLAIPSRRTNVLVPLRQGAVQRCREGLLGLADRLDGAASVNACGVARARVLLTDGTGPLYSPYPAHSLEETIWWIADGLGISRSRRGQSRREVHRGQGA